MSANVKFHNDARDARSIRKLNSLGTIPIKTIEKFYNVRIEISKKRKGEYIYYVKHNFIKFTTSYLTEYQYEAYKKRYF